MADINVCALLSITHLCAHTLTHVHEAFCYFLVLLRRCSYIKLLSKLFYIVYTDADVVTCTEGRLGPEQASERTEQCAHACTHTLVARWLCPTDNSINFSRPLCFVSLVETPCILLHMYLFSYQPNYIYVYLHLFHSAELLFLGKFLGSHPALSS